MWFHVEEIHDEPASWSAVKAALVSGTASTLWPCTEPKETCYDHCYVMWNIDLYTIKINKDMENDEINVAWEPR